MAAVRIGIQWIAAAAAVYLAVRSGTAFIPILFSFAAAFILYPCAAFLARLPLGAKRRVGMPAAILGSFLAAGLLICGVTAALFAPLIEEFNKLYKNIPQILTGIHLIFVEFESNVLLPLAKSGVYRQQSDQLIAFLQQAISGGLTFSFNVLKNLANLSVQLISRVVELIVVPALTFYFMKDWRYMTESFLTLFPAADRDKGRMILLEMGRVISDYLRGQFLLCLIIGAGMFAGMYGLDIEYPLVLALLAGVAEAIPIVGPVLSAVPPILLGALTSPALGIKAAAFCFVLQQLENHIIVPRVMGGSVNLHPASVIVSILIAGQFLGVGGMIVALPAIALAKVLMKHFWITEGK